MVLLSSLYSNSPTTTTNQCSLHLLPLDGDGDAYTRLMVSSSVHTLNITSELPIICVSKVYNIFLNGSSFESLLHRYPALMFVSKAQTVYSDRCIIGDSESTQSLFDGNGPMSLGKHLCSTRVDRWTSDSY